MFEQVLPHIERPDPGLKPAYSTTHYDLSGFEAWLPYPVKQSIALLLFKSQLS